MSNESRIMSHEWKIPATELLSIITRRSRGDGVLSHDSRLLTLRLEGAL